MCKLLIHVGLGERRVVDAASIYYAEAVNGDTLIRRRSSRRIRDVRELGEVEKAWRRHGFVRVHDRYLVNSDRIQWIRKLEGTRNWEVKLEPPVNAVLAVSRRKLAGLWRVFDERV